MKDENKNINNNNKDINTLFEKLIAGKREKLKNIEELKVRLISRLDLEIKKLYAKKDFIKDIILKREELKLQKIGVIKNIARNSFWMNIRYALSMPFIYIMLIPTFFFHVVLEIYHQVCFRLYGIDRIKMGEYFIFDRRFLPYLNWLEKINCFYCSYFNCLLSYAREVGGQTEKYWCPIKHSSPMKDPHESYNEFIDYSDAEALRKKWEELKDKN